MKSLYFLMIFFLLFSCTNNSAVYWCGDHACINKKEREAYFKKTMIVEIRNLKKEDIKKNSEIEIITQRAENNEKKRIKEEKALAREAKLDEKRRIKEEKALEKQINLEEKKRNKKEKKLSKQSKVIEKINREPKESSGIIVFKNHSEPSNEFDKILKKIIRKNTLRPYPDINDIPN